MRACVNSNIIALRDQENGRCNVAESLKNIAEFEAPIAAKSYPTSRRNRAMRVGRRELRKLQAERSAASRGRYGLTDPLVVN